MKTCRDRIPSSGGRVARARCRTRRIATAILGIAWTVVVGSSRAEDGTASLTAARADTVARPVTLAEAVALAERSNFSIIQAEGQVINARAGVRASYASFLPSVSVSAGASRRLPASSVGDTGDGSQGRWSLSSGIGADVTLFSGGRRIFSVQRARANVAAAELDAVSRRYEAVLSVKEQFMNVLAARESAAAAQAQLDQAEQQFRVSAARVRARVATKSDSLRAETQVRTARLAVLEARYAQTTASAALTRVAGAPYLITASDRDSLGGGALRFSDAELLAMAFESPQVRAARALLTAARAARKSAWASYLPSLSAGWSRGGSGSADSFDLGAAGDDYSGSVRLSLSLPLFDQLGRAEQNTQAAVALANAEAALRDVLWGVRADLTRQLATFRLAEARVATQAANVESSQEDLRLQQQRYALGESTLLDVLTSQTQLDSARFALIRARYDQRIAQAELEALLGREL